MDKLHIIKDAAHKTSTSDSCITLAHGNGGYYMRQLIDEIFVKHLGNPLLNTQADAATLPASFFDNNHSELVFSSDGVTVQPLIFPGGDIGSLAIHGTVNDLAVVGATPKYFSINSFLEEGLAISQLDSIVGNLAKAAQESAVHIVAGDTKVLPRGQCGGVYFGVSGIGVKPRSIQLGCQNIKAGDAVLISGPVGDHGIAVMLAREQFGLSGDVQSDSASILPFTQALLDLTGLRFMRDPTRGGLATVLCEIQQATTLGIQVEESKIPIRPAVQSCCEMLGYDPLYLACEGRVLAVVAPEQADKALERWQALPGGAHAQCIGYLSDDSDRVLLRTEWGGERVLQELGDDPLPRIC